MARRYEASQKHKWPKGFGSLCPAQMPSDVPQTLLQKAVQVPGMEGKLWAASGEWCFCAHPSRDDVWHGFPVLGGEVDERVLDVLETCGMLTSRERKQLRKQRELPKSWP